MTTRRSCPPAPGPLEDYAQRFDVLFSSLAQRRGLRDYLQGLLLPRDRNKTLTGLAGAEPITGAQHREVQRLQWFLSESAWDQEQVNDRRVQLWCQDPATAPHDGGVLVLDDTGDRKDGTATAHVARQDLGSVGKIDNGIVAVTSLWADERVYWPVQAVPYTPASRLPAGERDPGFRTKPQLAIELVQAAHKAGIRFQAVVADCFYGDNPGFTDALVAAKVPFVLALKPRRAPGRRRRRPTLQPRRPGSLAGTASRSPAGGGG
jgi:SRSO17 transposase